MGNLPGSELRHRNTAAKTAIGMSTGDMEYSHHLLKVMCAEG